jgi:hypothetical protein
MYYIIIEENIPDYNIMNIFEETLNEFIESFNDFYVDYSKCCDDKKCNCTKNKMDDELDLDSLPIAKKV